MIRLLEEHGHSLSMPYSKQITPTLYELRVRGRQEIRIFYCFHNQQAVIIHAFFKKSQKTPHKEIKTALSRISQLT
jgi:phage-related protein